MLDSYSYFLLKLLAALGCGLIAGVFFAFSSFVMRALAEIETPQGIAAMQSINSTVINPSFMIVFLGTAVVCLLLLASFLVQWQQAGTIYGLAGSLLYLLGTFLVTILGNVPLNDALAELEPNSAAGSILWRQYLNNWTRWNHVRTMAAFAAAAMFILALRS